MLCQHCVRSSCHWGYSQLLLLPKGTEVKDFSLSPSFFPWYVMKALRDIKEHRSSLARQKQISEAHWQNHCKNISCADVLRKQRESVIKRDVGQKNRMHFQVWKWVMDLAQGNPTYSLILQSMCICYMCMHICVYRKVCIIYKLDVNSPKILFPLPSVICDNNHKDLCNFGS